MGHSLLSRRSDIQCDQPLSSRFPNPFEAEIRPIRPLDDPIPSTQQQSTLVDPHPTFESTTADVAAISTLLTEATKLHQQLTTTLDAVNGAVSKTRDEYATAKTSIDGYWTRLSVDTQPYEKIWVNGNKKVTSGAIPLIYA